MRIGLVADVHESVENLRRALGILRRERIDRFALLGDVFERGPRLEETVAVLIDAGVPPGVWGNHDFGLRSFAAGEPRFPFSPVSADYFRRMVPRASFDGLLLQHVPPPYDPTTIEGIWSCFDEEFFTSAETLARCFDEPGDWTTCLCGHFHRWSNATPAGFTDWTGESPLRLDRSVRRLISVGAVAKGACGLLDTDAEILVPFAF